MMLSIGLPIALTGRGHGGAAPPPQPSRERVAQISDTPRDRFVFDSGAALGLSAAPVPVSGAATEADGTTQVPDGTGIEIRAVSIDDGGATSTPWRDAGTTSGGAWFSSLSVPRSTSWFRAEARVKGSTAPAARQNNRFGSGHVWAIWEQSNWARLMDPAGGEPPAPPITHPGDVVLIDRGGPTIVEGVDNGATPTIPGAVAVRTAAQVAFINALSAERPGEKFAVAFHTQAGKSFADALTDETENDDGRDWDVDVAAHDLLTGDGVTQVGFVSANGWIAANGADAGTANSFTRLFTGRDIADGAPFTLADTSLPRLFFAVNQDGTQGGGFYDLDYTRVGWVGNHGRDNNPGTDPATVSTVEDLSGYGLDADDDYEAMMDLFQEHLGQPYLPETLPWQMETIGGQRGDYNPGDGRWSDVLHFSARQRDGRVGLAEIGALAMLKTVGLVSWDVPELNQRYDEPAGAWADFWIAGRDMDTMREHLHRTGQLSTWRLSQAPQPSYPMPTTYPHWTQVMGWEIDGVPAERAELHTVTAADIADGHTAPEGAVICRVYPNGGGAFNFGSNIVYGPGRFIARQLRHEDLNEAHHLNYLSVDMGQAGRPLLPVTPRSSRNVPSTLPQPVQFTVGDNTIFFDGAQGPKQLNETQFDQGRLEIVFSLDDVSGSAGRQTLGTITSEFQVVVLAGGSIQIRSSAGFGTAPAGTIVAGTTYRVVAVQDRANDLVYLELGPPDGPLSRVAEENGTIGMTAGDTFRGGQQIRFLKGHPNDPVKGGTFTSLKVWLGDPDGIGAPDKVVAGDAATVNADPWLFPNGDPAT